MKNTMKKIVRFTLATLLTLAALLFFMIITFKSEEVIALLEETLTYVIFEVVLSKVGIGIIAFTVGGILVMAYGGKRQIQDETTIAYLSKELAETKEELELYKAREVARQNEQEELDKTRVENGKAIIKAIS